MMTSQGVKTVRAVTVLKWDYTNSIHIDKAKTYLIHNESRKNGSRFV